MILRSERLVRTAGLVALVALVCLFVNSARAAAPTKLIKLTPEGLEALVISTPSHYVHWKNVDTRHHRVVFDNGMCSFSLAPGETKTCTFGREQAQDSQVSPPLSVSFPVGDFSYQVTDYDLPVLGRLHVTPFDAPGAPIAKPKAKPKQANRVKHSAQKKQQHQKSARSKRRGGR